MPLPPSKTSPTGRQFRTFIEQFARDATEEALSVTVDPTNGSAADDYTRFTRQGEFTTHGSFDTVASALLVLPPKIRHAVTITIVAGTHTITDSFFGDFSPFTFGASGQLTITGAALAQVSGTSTLTVSSVSNNHDITLTATAGTADAYAGDFAVVTAGTGLGNIRVISQHTTTNLKIAGTVTWDNTTQFEIQRPTTILSFSGADNLVIVGSGQKALASSPTFVSIPIVFQNLRIDGGAAKRIDWVDMPMQWERVQWRYIRHLTRGASPLSLGIVTIDGVSGNTSNTALSVQSEASMSAGTDGDGFLIYNWSVGVSSGAFAAVHASLFRFTIRACTTGISMAAHPGAGFRIDSNSRAISISDVFASVTRGNFQILKTWATGAQAPVGTTNAVKLGGTAYSWADIDAETTFTDTKIGPLGASIGLY